MSISRSLRRKIVAFDPMSVGVSVKVFCRQEGISTSTFYNIKARFKRQGFEGLEPDSRAPKQPARIWGQEATDLVVETHNRLKAEGKDSGPWSVYYCLIDDASGCYEVPSRATIARILAREGCVDKNARKRPRTSYERFAKTEAMQMWQIDAFVYRLFDSDHSTVTIYQLIDDASRLDVGTQAFPTSENSRDAQHTLSDAFATYGLPCQVLSDNGTAFATYHLGRVSPTEKFLAKRGVLPIAGFAPTTQGKVERSHQTLSNYLDKRCPTNLEQVREHIVSYRTWYNTLRRHQGLLAGKQHITPAQAFTTLPKATPPQEPISQELLFQRAQDNRAFTKKKRKKTPKQPAPSSRTDNYWNIGPTAKTDTNGIITVTGVRIYIGYRYKKRDLAVNVTDDNIAQYFTAHDGELLFTIPLPIRTHHARTSQININHIIGAWHRNPPQVSKKS